MLGEATIKKHGENYSVSYGEGNGIYAHFFMDAVQDMAASESAGRPIFKDTPMVKIVIAGDSTKQVIKPAHDGEPKYSDRFPEQWARFNAQQEQGHTGTPIEHWPPLTKSQALELKAMNIHTVEMLAGCSDANLRWMGARQMRDNAKAWLNEADNGSETIRLRNEIEQLRIQLEAMRNQNAGILASQPAPVVVNSEQIAAPLMEAPEIKPIVTKMRGRPRKVEDGTDVPATNTASGE
jgi:hypothetical protein